MLCFALLNKYTVLFIYHFYNPLFITLINYNINKKYVNTFKVYFNRGNIVIEDFNNKEKFIIEEKDYI